jgi:hypothetical protein
MSEPPAREEASAASGADGATVPTPSSRRSRRWAAALRLHPFELYTYGMMLAVILFLRASGFRMGSQALAWTLPPMLANLPRALAIGLVLHAVGFLVTRSSPRPWLRAVLTLPSALLWLRVWLAVMAMTFTYTWLKVCVPLLRTTLLDAELWKLDRWLHFGFSPSIFAVELLGGTALLPLLDRWYGFWLTSVLGALAYFLLAAEPHRRRRFVLACALLWTLGAGLYLALPALGPCYANPEVFRSIESEIPRSDYVQRLLWANYTTLVAGRDGTLTRFSPYLGVAALPSLHVGAHWLFAIWSWRHARRLFLPFALATLLTLLGSVATGWHYALDGYAGMLLAWGAVRLAERWEPAPIGAREVLAPTSRDESKSPLS